jgi:hypothetical protein
MAPAPIVATIRVMTTRKIPSEGGTRRRVNHPTMGLQITVRKAAIRSGMTIDAAALKAEIRMARLATMKRTRNAGTVQTVL